MSRRHLIALAAAIALAPACNRRPSFSDPSRPIEVRAGGEFVLSLESNQSTGYQWVLADSAALGPLQLVSKDYTIPPLNGGRNGAGGIERWTFHAVRAGSGIVSLAYQRPWETKPPAESARFRVTVR